VTLHIQSVTPDLIRGPAIDPKVAEQEEAGPRVKPGVTEMQTSVCTPSPEYSLDGIGATFGKASNEP